MKIAVVGATGRTGQRVIEQALARGDDVIAVAHHPETLPQSGPGMIGAAADVLDRAALAGALAGAYAVVSAVGIGASRQPRTVYPRRPPTILPPTLAPPLPNPSLTPPSPPQPPPSHPA